MVAGFVVEGEKGWCMHARVRPCVPPVRRRVVGRCIIYHPINTNTNINPQPQTPTLNPQWAAVQGHTEVARCLLDFGAALDGTEWEMGRTALYMAAGRGHVSFVDLLLSRGANPSLRRAGGRTPLGIAAYNGHTEVVRLLLRHPHCDLDGRDDQGCTPLWQVRFWRWAGLGACVFILLGVWK